MSSEPAPSTAYLVFDAESIPDGVLLARLKYRELEGRPEEAIARAQAEARENSRTGSDFLPVTFQIPVSVCVARIAADHRLLSIRCLDAPHYRTRQIVRDFWTGLGHYRGARLVSFNGRSFDLPLLELAAFRYGLSAREHFTERYGSRNRYSDAHIDLLEMLGNYGAVRLAGGLNLLSKLLGKPGKVEASGDQVYEMHRRGEIQAINEYCSFDVLDTYFVFLRTRVLTGELTVEEEQIRVQEARDWIAAQAADQPHLKRYLDHWGDWNPWP